MSATTVTSHPGIVLMRYFMKPAELSINALARKLDVPPNRICAIVNGDRAITADTAVRLGRFFNTTPEFWMNMQSKHDLLMISEDELSKIETKVTPLEKSDAVRFLKAAE